MTLSGTNWYPLSFGDYTHYSNVRFGGNNAWKSGNNFRVLTRTTNSSGIWVRRALVTDDASDLWQMREIDTLEQILPVPCCSCCRMQDSLCHVLYELHLGPYTMTITQFVRLKAAGSMLQIDRNMTQVEGSETETEPQPEPAKQTKLSLKVINLSSHRLHVKFEHQLQSWSSRGSPPPLSTLHVVLLIHSCLYLFVVLKGTLLLYYVAGRLHCVNVSVSLPLCSLPVSRCFSLLFLP